MAFLGAIHHRSGEFHSDVSYGLPGAKKPQVYRFLLFHPSNQTAYEASPLIQEKHSMPMRCSPAVRKPQSTTPVHGLAAVTLSLGLC